MASEYERIRRQCLKRGELWEDTEFPTTQTSIFYHQSPPFQFVWKRPKVNNNNKPKNCRIVYLKRRERDNKPAQHTRKKKRSIVKVAGPTFTDWLLLLLQQHSRPVLVRLFISLSQIPRLSPLSCHVDVMDS
jgi:hypothetical protein